mgnify:CR=1 FL=1
MSLVQYPYNLHAGGAVTGATGATIAGSRGFTCSRASAGAYTITLNELADTQTPFEVVPVATIRASGVATFFISVGGSADGQFFVSIFNLAGAAADADFNFACFRANVGNAT